MKLSKWLPPKGVMLYIVVASIVMLPLVGWPPPIGLIIVIVGGAYAGEYGQRKLAGWDPTKKRKISK
jgi:hypothetical protein